MMKKNYPTQFRQTINARKFLFLCLNILIVNYTFAQGITTNGKITTTGSEYVNKNGTIGSSTGVDKNGNVVIADPLPALTTTAISLISTTGATSGGNITSIGSSNVTDRGICWSTAVSPTIAGSKVSNGAGGLGSFTANLTGLSQSTVYYVRAYATNSSGTAYGNELNFTTYGPPVGGNAICDGTHPTSVVEITSTTGKIWMDRNLGASRAATSVNDYEAYGCLYQWGRGNDGHASVTWSGSTTGTAVSGLTTTLSPTDVPGNSLFINPNGVGNDWRSTSNDNLWQGVSGINNPCPAGFRVPTITEVEAETPTVDTAVNGVLKFVKQGYRQGGGFIFQGTVVGYIPSSTVSGINVLVRSFISTISSSVTPRSYGNAVRCIKD